MDNYKEIASKLIVDFENSPYVVSGGNAEGLWLQAWRDPEKVCFDYNLGGSFVPTKKEAEEMLAKMQRHVDKLCAASPELVAFIDNRRIEISLIVFSGQMDFAVAKLVNNEITWLVNLN